MLAPNKTSTLAVALLAATCLTPPDGARAEPDDPLGGEFRVNSEALGNQSSPAVAMAAAGNFVVAWTSDGQDGNYNGIFAQRFDAGGVAQGPEVQVNSFTTERQQMPAVATDADGDFIVTWESLGQDGDGYGIYAQRYDASGNAQGAEFRVNTFTTGDQRSPAVAMDAEGDFVVTWQSVHTDGSPVWRIFAQRFDAAGVAQGPEIQVNAHTVNFQMWSAVAMDADGDFVVAWASDDQDGNLQGVFAQRFDRAGAVQGDEFRVNSFTTGEQTLPAVAMDADGDFVVAWRSYDQDGDSWGIFAQRFDAMGVVQGPELQVNDFTTGSQSVPTLALDADGDFVVAWQSYSGQDGSSFGVFAQRFDAAGNAIGGEFAVNTYTTNGQSGPSVAIDADGDFVVAWESDGQDGSSFGVYAQRFQGDGPVAGDFTVDGRADILWRNVDTGNAVLWQMDGFDKLATGSIGGAGTEWQVRALADFNADTKTDVLWRNTSNGNAVIWLMDGFAKLDGGGIGGAGPEWAIVGAGDVDGDDHADILWRNTVTGANVIWKMDGLSKTGSGGIGGVPLAWEVAGLGDFNADAKSDILWHNAATGAAVVWLMDGFAKLDTGSAGAPPPDWQVAGLGTFNSDARWDVLWRNAATGGAVIWKMNGLVKEEAQAIGAAPLVWRVAGVGDTDGDRQSDIIWRNTDTGAAVVWRMDGFVKDAAQSIGAPPLVWEVQ